MADFCDHVGQISNFLLRASILVFQAARFGRGVLGVTNSSEKQTFLGVFDMLRKKAYVSR
jgi:hypothetical protein